MTNIALIIAGGVGSRMQQAVPKQFMTVYDKPVIVYTMEQFQSHPSIDGIVVTCLSGWENVLETYAKQYNITKLVYTAEAGAVGQESIKNGLLKIKEHYSHDTVVLIHDGNRPMVSKDIISDCIATTKLRGNAIACIPCQEAILETSDGIISTGSYPRENLKRTQTPHGFILQDLLNAHEKAKEKNIVNSVASCTLLDELGEHVYFSSGSEKNIKITTPEDIEIFKALIKDKKNEY